MSAFSNTIDRIRRHKAVAGAGAFLSWWKEQLLEGLPASWREKLHAHRTRFLVRFEDDDVVLSLENGEEVARLPRQEEPAIAGQTVAAVLGRFEEDDPEFIFVLDSSSVLSRVLTLPAATEENLARVLSFEMDRHTPFSPSQVYFDTHVLDRVAGGSKIRAGLVLAKRPIIDEIVEFAKPRGMSLHAVDVAVDEEQRAGVNLLPLEVRAQHDRRQLQWNVALAALFCGLLYTVLWQSVATREAALVDYQQRLSDVRAEAAEVMALRDELTEARDAATFLARRKEETPSMINLLAELTDLLPDDTWLQRLQITGDSVQISGQTPETARLVGLMETGSTTVCDPNIRGAVTPDQASGKERFTIEGQLCTRELADDEPPQATAALNRRVAALENRP